MLHDDSMNLSKLVVSVNDLPAPFPAFVLHKEKQKIYKYKMAFKKGREKRLTL